MANPSNVFNQDVVENIGKTSDIAANSIENFARPLAESNAMYFMWVESLSKYIRNLGGSCRDGLLDIEICSYDEQFIETYKNALIQDPQHTISNQNNGHDIKQVIEPIENLLKSFGNYKIDLSDLEWSMKFDWVKYVFKPNLMKINKMDLIAIINVEKAVFHFADTVSDAVGRLRTAKNDIIQTN